MRSGNRDSWKAHSDGDSRPVVSATPNQNILTGFRSILVPVDGEQLAEHALPLALGIARRSGAEVRLVSVYSPFRSFDHRESFYGSNLDSYFYRRQHRYLNELVKRLGQVSSAPVRSILLRGTSVANSLLTAASVGTDLVVMATRTRGPFGRFWFGSMARELMQHLHVPMLLVRGYDAPVDLTGDPLMRHILVPIVGWADAVTILEPALELGASTNARYTLLQVVPFTGERVPSNTAKQPPEDTGLGMDSTRLNPVTQALRTRSIEIDCLTVRVGQSVSQTILDFARSNGVDLIAMPMHNNVLLRSLLQTGVTDKVIRGANVPVLVRRSDRSPPPIAVPMPQMQAI